MPNNHTKKGQLSQGERQIIEILRKNNKGKSYREIGDVLRRDHTVISREIQRNDEYKGWGIIHYLAIVL